MKLNHRYFLCIFTIAWLLTASSIFADETFHEYLVRTTKIESGPCIHFQYVTKGGPLSVSIQQTSGSKPYRIFINNVTTEFTSNEYDVVIALGPRELPDFLNGQKTKGCAISISVGSDAGGAWRVRQCESFIESESQKINFVGATDGSVPITIKISDLSFVVNVREIIK